MEAEPIRSTRTPSVDVHGLLLTAADAVLRREGLAGVTVRGVAAEAGVAPGGVYSRFGGKDGLIDALLIRGFDDLGAATAPRGESDARERLFLLAGGPQDDGQVFLLVLDGEGGLEIAVDHLLPEDLESP